MYDWGVFEELTAAIEGLDISPCNELFAAIALRDRLDARMVEATSAVEATGC